MNLRILVVDDNPQILEDFRKLLAPKAQISAKLSNLEDLLFGDLTPRTGEEDLNFDVDGAFQGEEGHDRAKDAATSGTPYAVAVVDMQMPPGWDGIETIKRIRDFDNKMFVIVCTAHSEYTFEQIHKALDRCDRVCFVAKPFDPKKTKDLVGDLARKWTKVS